MNDHDYPCKIIDIETYRNEDNDVQIEAIILESNKLTKNDVMVYLALKRLKDIETGECNPSTRTIMKLSKVRNVTMLESRRRLARLGLIKYKKRQGKTYYTITLEDGTDQDIKNALQRLGVYEEGVYEY